MKTNEGGAAFGAIGKERSKLLAMVLVISMVFAGLAVVTSGMGTSDAEPQGEAISDYQSLKTAFTTGGAYYLGGDITIEQSSDLEVTAEVILDLNGHSLSKTFEQQNNFLIVINNGSLTINDSGTNGKISSADYGIQLRSNSSLTLNGGAIETVQEAIDLYTSVSNVDVLIAGGSVTSTEDSVMNVRGSTGINVQITGGEMVSNGRTAFYVSSYQEHAIAISMTGGSVEHNNGRSGAFQIYSGAHVTIGGDATISADYVALQLQAGVSSSTLDITGGTISSESRTGAIVSTEDDATLTISGGEFNSSGVVLDASEDSNVIIDGSGVEISGELSGNATLTVNNGASMTVIEELEMSSTSKMVNNGTIDFEVTPEGAQDSNLTGSGIIIGYEGEGFADSIKVGGESISADDSNFEQIITSMNENPGMFTGITQVTVTEDVTITDLVQIPEEINVSTDYVFIVDPVDEDSDVGVILMSGATFTGTIRMADKTEVVATDLMAESELIIRFGSIYFDGTVESGSAVLTSYNGEDVNITGFLKSGVQITIVQGTEGIDVPMRFDRFDEGEGQVLFKAFGSEETTSEIPDWVDAIYAGSVTIGGLTITNNATYFYDGTSQYPDQMTAYVSGIISQGFINKDRSEIATSDSDLGVYTIRDGELVLTDAFNAGTYYVYYGYFVDGVLHPYLCEWEIWGIDATITIDEISKAYDGTIDVVNEFTLPNNVPNVTFGAPVYDDEYVGENKIVTIPITFAAGSVPDNYFFLVNDQYQQVWGDSTSGYYIVLEGAITQREITIDITVDVPEDNPIVKEYDGTEFEYIFSSNDVTGVSGDILTLTVTTTGSNAGTYTGSSLEYVCVVDNGELEVTDSYIVTYSSNNYLTIDEKDITISPAPDRDITKEYNGWSSRIMSESDFQMSGAIDGDDVSFGWTPGASNIWYNSSNVLEANTLTVNGLFLEGEDSSNYELPNTTVVFVDGENGLTVGITPMVLTISNGSDTSIEKTYDNGNTVPSGQIDTNDYSVSAAQNGTYPDININAAVFGSVDAGTDLTVYVTDATLVDGDNGVASNFALPEMQTTVDGIRYYFSITGANVKINPITVDGNMVKGSYSEQDGKIILTVTVKSEDLEDLEDLELTDFGSTLKFGEETIDAIAGTNSYIIDKSGRYTATVTSNDDNWIASNFAAPIDVDFDYTANFFTQTTLNGEYILELTVSFENGMVHTPAATNVPEGYELVGWRTADGIEYGVGEYAPVSAIGTDFYAVYEEIGGSTPEPTGPTITIDIPDEFPIGTEIEFTVSTTAGNYTGGNVQGTGIFEGILGVDYNIWYWEVQDDSWHEWISGNFGPEGGFPLIDATSKFKIQFINAGTYDLTVQIVTVSDNDVVCETSAVVDVPAENSLGYHVLDALDYVYVDGGEYNADAYSYIAEFDADADSIIATYGHEYFEALIAYITNTETDEQADMAEDVMNDFARYMGALYRSSDGDVGRVYFNGTEYVWKAATDGKWLNGCNWRNENGVTLTSAVVDYIESTQSTGIIMEIAVPGGDRQVLTYSAVFEDAPTPDIQYYNVTLAASEGVQFYVLDGSIVVAGTYSVAEGAHTISAVAADGWQFTGGVPAFNGAENGQFEVVDQDVTISVSNVEQIVEESLKYTVNFSYQLVDGTAIETGQPESMTVYFPSDQVPTVVLPVPTIDGCTFVGWYDSDGAYFSGGGQVVLTSTETSLTARFIQMATYTVVFSGEGGQTYSNVAIGDAVVAPEVEVAEGYMAYWATENGFIVDLGERYYLSSMDVGENNTVTFTLVTEEIPEDPTYTITIPTGTGYTSMSETISGIVSGQDRTFTINPTAGYAIRAVNATYDEGGDVTINSYQNGESWIVTIYGITGDITITVTVEQKDVVDGVFVEADYAPNGASVTLSPVSSGDDGILPNGTITVFYTYRTTVTIDGVQYEGNTTGSFTAVEYTNDDGSSIDHVSVTGDYPESTIRGYAVFTDEEGNSYYSTFFTVNVLSEAGE